MRGPETRLLVLPLCCRLVRQRASSAVHGRHGHRARVLLAGLLMPLPEPTTEAELKKLKLKGRGSTAYPLGHKKNTEMDPKYKGSCCNGTRVWGANDCRPYTFVNEKGAEFSVFCCGACRQPLPLPQLPPAATPAAAVTSPVTLTAEQLATIEEKRQAALARKRAREEASTWHG